MSTSAYNKEQV